MEDVFGVQPREAAKGIKPASQLNPQACASASSNASQMSRNSRADKPAVKVRGNAPVRMYLIQRIRGEIATGTYETPERLDGTVERLMEEFFPEYFSN